MPDHLLQIRCVCRIGPGDAFEIVGRHVKLNGEGKDVDNLRRVVSREVRSENSVGAVLKQDLVAAMFFTDTDRGCPLFGVPSCTWNSSPRSFAPDSVNPTVANCGIVKTALATPA